MKFDVDIFVVLNMHLAQPVTVVWLAHKIQVNFEFLKFNIDQNFKLSIHFTKLLEQYASI